MGWRTMLCLVIAAFLGTGAPALAGEYFGFRPGVQTFEEVRTQLQAEGATYEDDYGYRGSSELASIKLVEHERLRKFGAVRDAWLEFGMDRKLYRVTVGWGDAGETFKVLRDALEGKYGRPQTAGFGFTQHFDYRDGKVAIRLTRNTFGFGSDQTTTVTYTYAPATASVEAAKARIEDRVRKANAAKAGGDI